MGKPRLNHVAMSVPAELLGESARKELVDFYGDVFGWTEVTQMTKDSEILVLQVHRFDQFVFLVAGDEPMRAGPRDHFGTAVDNVDELDAILERAKARAEVDDRVRVIDKEVEEHGPVQLTSCYIGFLLPLMIEVQHYEVTAG